jgi:Mg2+/Co2+ transporter CorC
MKHEYKTTRHFWRVVCFYSVDKQNTLINQSFSSEEVDHYTDHK